MKNVNTTWYFYSLNRSDVIADEINMPLGNTLHQQTETSQTETVFLGLYYKYCAL